MFRWITDILFGHETNPSREITPGTRPGTQVVRQDDGLQGTLSGLQHLDGAWYARVVFTGVRSTWVEVVEADSLLAA